MGAPNPMAGLPGIPPAQMQYLQRQFHQMAGQGMGGMPSMSGGIMPPSPAAGYPNFSGGQPGDLLPGQSGPGVLPRHGHIMCEAVMLLRATLTQAVCLGLAHVLMSLA